MAVTEGTPMSQTLVDQVVLVTGGARGLGAAYARGIVEAGGTAVIADLRVDEGRELAAGLGPRAQFVELDVTDPESWERAVHGIAETYGHFDGLVNNAGISASGVQLVDEAIETFDAVIATNLRAVFLGMRAVVPAMRDSGGGSIVNISSVAGLVGLAMTGAYGAAKWAVRGMTKTAAVELGPVGIRVNSLQPGMILTPMTEPTGISADAGGFPGTPLRRVGTPEELVAAVTYLLSEDSSYTSGAELTVDGGWTAGISMVD